MNFKINSLIKDIKTKILSCCQSEHEAEQQAWWMIEELTKKNKSTLILEKKIDLAKNQEQTLYKWINQRTIEKKPLQYILGHVPFCNLDILLKPPILIPRPETEELACWLIKKLNKVNKEKLNILDICTGTGCIALALAKELPNSTVLGTDINKEAIKLAKKNKLHNKIKNSFFLISDFYSNINKDKKFDLIVSNPPYITKEEFENLNDTIKNWEDPNALIANKKGLASFEEIIKNSKNYLKSNNNFKKLNIPQIILEIGKNQENEVKKLLIKDNFININIFPDLKGINRWITASF